MNIHIQKAAAAVFALAGLLGPAALAVQQAYAEFGQDVAVAPISNREGTSPVFFFDGSGVTYFDNVSKTLVQQSLGRTSSGFTFDAPRDLPIPTFSETISKIFWPDAGQSFIVYSYDEEFKPVFYIYEPNSHSYTVLPRSARTVAWMPNGIDLLYLDYNESAKQLTLIQTNRNLTSSVPIATFSNAIGFGSIDVSSTGDSAMVHYQLADDNVSLRAYLVALSSKATEEMLLGEGEFIGGFWSPDGAKYAFIILHTNGNTELIISTVVYHMPSEDFVTIGQDNLVLPLVFTSDSQGLYVMINNELSSDGFQGIAQYDVGTGQASGPLLVPKNNQTLAVPGPGTTVLDPSDRLMLYTQGSKVFALPLDGSTVTVTATAAPPVSPPPPGSGLQYPTTAPGTSSGTQVVLPAGVRAGEVIKFYNPSNNVHEAAIYLVKTSGLYPFATEEDYNHYITVSGKGLRILPKTTEQYTYNSIDAAFVLKTTTPPDMPQLKSGQLVNSSGTIYLILGNEAIPFHTYSVFTGLGYNVKNAVNADITKYDYSITPGIKAANVPHPWGSWVKFGETIYYSSPAGMVGVPTWDLFLSNGGRPEFIVPANTYDQNELDRSPSLPVLTHSDPRVMH